MAGTCRRSEPDRRDRTPQPDVGRSPRPIAPAEPRRRAWMAVPPRVRGSPPWSRQAPPWLFAHDPHGRDDRSSTTQRVGERGRQGCVPEGGAGSCQHRRRHADADDPNLVRLGHPPGQRHLPRGFGGNEHGGGVRGQGCGGTGPAHRRIDPYREQTDQPRDPLPAKLPSQVKDVGAVATAVHSVGVTNQDGVDAVLGKHTSRAAVIGELVHAGTDDNLGRVVQTGPADRADHDRTLGGQGADEVPCVLGESVPTWRIRRDDSHPQRPPSQRVSPRLRPILALARRRRDRT